MSFFEKCNTQAELKKAYHQAAIANHPDLGGDLETMKQVVADYTARFEYLEKHAAPDAKPTTETPEKFVAIVNVLCRLQGLEVELCGQWLWIGGDTKTNKDALKAAGCRWCSKKKLWSWHHQEDGVFRGKRTQSMSDIRNKYGSQSLSGRYSAVGITA